VPVRNRVVEELPGQLAELRQHMIETRLVDGIQPVRRSSDRSKAHFPKADLAGQVPEDSSDVRCRRRERHPGAYGPGAVTPQQFADPGRDDVIAPGAVVKHAELVLYFSGPVVRDRDYEAYLRAQLYDFKSHTCADCLLNYIKYSSNMYGYTMTVWC